MLTFAIVTISAAYWAVVERDQLLSREDNPRVLEARAAIQRGAIYDRTGTLLAVSEPGPGRQRVRTYLHPETYGALGYYSLRYGAGNVEAFFEPILSGATQPLLLEDYILQSPQVGADIQLTLDLGLQRAISSAMAGKMGAVVVLAVPTGEVLGLMSAPTYNPNSLDQDWESLRTMPGNPFFNRPLQGRYQPGGIFQTPLLSRLLLSTLTVDTLFENATEPVRIGDLRLECAVPTPTTPLTLRDAYAFGCPEPFAELADTLPDSAINELMGLFTAFNRFDFAAAASQAQPALVPTLTSPLAPDDRQEIALGQGQLTISPMSMALLTAAIINGGNSPQPELLLATRLPEADWSVWQTSAPTLPLMTQLSAQQLQDLMRYAVTNGAAASAQHPTFTIGGHAALAYTGESTLAWFVGFNVLQNRGGAVVAVTIENSRDPGEAAEIGGAALQAAAVALEAASATIPGTQP
jgi:peptidoglycan glycosyltransferase